MTEWDATKYEGAYIKDEDLGVIAEHAIFDDPDTPLFPNARVVAREVWNEPVTIVNDEELPSS